jgi:ligand-binding SRPBCC domain-containing protein
MARHVLEQTQVIPYPRAEVFPFFAAAENLERITPSFLGFRIITPPPIEMRKGTLIDYHIKLSGLPLRWRTEITEWQPNHRFVDLQLRGPYRYWHHLHEFRDVPGGTEMHDRVDYELPFGPLGSAAHALYVRRTLESIFQHRRRIIDGLFAHPASPPAAV